MSWKHIQYYPKAGEVEKWSKQKALKEYKAHNEGIAFREFTEAQQYGVFMRALKKKLNIKR